MTPERYLVHLNPQNPQIGGFSYGTLDRAVLALVDTRQRWPRATLVVIPAKPCEGKIRKTTETP